MSANRPAPARPHIYEFDLLRSLTAVTVVAVHTLGFTYWLYPNGNGVDVHYAVLDTIHWTRYIFLFITAFVLTYVYYGRPFSAGRFWWKRAMGVLLPYAMWSIAYTWTSNHAPHEPLAFARVALLDIVTGNASYQLYYILLTLQMYLIFPLFLWLLKRIAQHPWWALGTSFVLELVFTYISYQYIQQGPFAASPLGSVMNDWQNRFLLTYQFYVILGGIAALHAERLREILLSHGKAVVATFIVGLVLAVGSYALMVRDNHTDPSLASATIQPVATIYSFAVIVFLCWLGALWARRAVGNAKPRAYQFWHLLSDGSFGIYLVHAFILTYVFINVLSKMPDAWPPGLRIFLCWLITASSAVLFSVVILYIPVASHLVGRPVQWHFPRRTATPRASGSPLPREGNVEAQR